MSGTFENGGEKIVCTFRYVCLSLIYVYVRGCPFAPNRRQLLERDTR